MNREQRTVNREQRPGSVDSSPEGDAPGLPFLRTWRAVYGFVIATFVVWLVLLWAVMQGFA